MLHPLRLCYYWPGMFSCVTKMCHACPGCALTNPNKGKSAKLVYGFLIEAPFLVLHVYAYSAGTHTGFKGSSTYLIACCGMCLCRAIEPISNANATTFASAIMKIMFRFGFAHTVVVNKDSKFFWHLPQIPLPPKNSLSPSLWQQPRWYACLTAELLPQQRLLHHV
jgi:hypothetical protein